MSEDNCILCEEKLDKGESSALFYCEKCREQKENNSELFKNTGLQMEWRN